MKKTIFPILTILMVLLFWSSGKSDTIYSDDDTMKIADAYGLPGDAVDVSMIMSNTIPIEGIQHRIVFDETLLELDTIFCVDRGCNLEAFNDTLLNPGVIWIVAVTWESTLIPPGIGEVINIRFNVRQSATPGTVTSVEFEDEALFINAWSDSLGANLIIPQLIPGNFSILGGGINVPPVIGYIGSQSVAEGQLLQFNVTAYDPDADPLTLTASGLPPNATFPPAQGDSLVSSTFSFTPDFTQGPDTFIVTFSVSDDHNNITELLVQIVVFDQPNDLISVTSDQGGIPGASGRPVDVVLHNTRPIYGAQYEISYDPTVIDVPEVYSTQRCINMWFNYNEPEPGRIIVVIFGVGLDSIAAGQGPITELVVDVGNDTTFGPSDIVFLSAIEAIDSIGTAKVLDTEDGYFTVDRYGDANLDGTVNVGDCLSIVAHIIGVHSYNQRQREAADYNGNGFVDIGDLQDIVNFILEIFVVPQGTPEGPPVVVELLDTGPHSGDRLSVPLSMELPTEASAVQFEIQYNSDNLNCTDLVPGEMASGMALDYNVTDAAIRCVIYNLGGGNFGPASGELVELEFELTGVNFDAASDISISEFTVVNPSADFMPVEIKGRLPDNFVLGQNYPNPFNAGTNIVFNLPRSGQINLQIYDLLGRSVVTLHDGFMQAGSHTVFWDGRSAAGNDLATGVYFYRLQADDFDKTKKMLLIK
ncbi:MAG: T9SS type A sorting domain-containing protein [Candidatus Zixiibacteriota bacterium]|nr:MAG: T9SS type A sorting domain-containing protein [candidate division Zixibacteria bacterium]